jgi:uncharacterized OB-fold protein
MAASQFSVEDDSVTAAERPIPTLEDELWASFYGYCVQGELRFQRCERCQSWRHPPRPLCARCHSPRWTWEASSRRGRIHSWTIVHQALHPAFATEVPYAVLLGEMDEGVRLIARLRKADLGVIPLALDLPIAVEFEPVSSSIALPFFGIVNLDGIRASKPGPSEPGAPRAGASTAAGGKP